MAINTMCICVCVCVCVCVCMWPPFAYSIFFVINLLSTFDTFVSVVDAEIFVGWIDI